MIQQLQSFSTHKLNLFKFIVLKLFHTTVLKQQIT